jgi:hypothetical protein
LRVESKETNKNQESEKIKMKRIKVEMLALVSGVAAALLTPATRGDVVALGNTTENTSGYRTFQATAVAIGFGKRVTVDVNGLISVAAAAVGAIGVTTEAIAASGRGTVKLFNAPGTFMMVANAAIARGAQLFPTAGGNVDDAGVTALPLVALEAATAQNDIIECAPLFLGA